MEPGVTNLAVSQAARPFGLFYAPDPSSQVICSVGGNVAENSGGAHCLKHGFTVHHVTGLEIVTPEGELTWLGDGTGAAPGYDLVGAFTGSEGTLGIVTKIVVKLTRIPRGGDHAAGRVRDDGGRRRGRLGDHRRRASCPPAIEMMDALAIEAAEAAVACRYPEGAGAVLIVELDGPEADVSRETAAVRALCEQAGATRSGRPTTRPSGPRSGPAASPRSPPWAGSARPTSCRTAWCRAPRWRRCSTGSPSCRAASGIRVANVFHAGDGNLHPLVLFDDLEPGGRARRPRTLSGAILDLCIEHGGSITGEHGVGVDKSRYMPKMFSADDLDTMQLLRCAFDPAGLCNPGKIFPTPAAVRRGARVPGAVRIRWWPRANWISFELPNGQRHHRGRPRWP